MSTALDQFLAGSRAVFIPVDKEAAWAAFNSAAAEWREAGLHASAAIAMQGAIQAAWGDGLRVEDAVRSSVRDCQLCIERGALDSLEALVAINTWLSLLHYFEQAEAR